MLTNVILFLLVPTVATFLGGAAAVFWTPGAQLRSALQHLAAGVVFAAVAGELLPEIMHEGTALPVIVGFSAGIALMLAIKWLAENGKMDRFGAEGGMITIIGIDIAIDGLLVGVSFSAGAKAGILVTFALSLEVLFLALSTAATQLDSGTSKARVLITAAVFSLALVVSAIAGVTMVSSLTPAMLEAVLSFGVAALLYLVTEELLVEAHESKVAETSLTTATFFVGFLVIILIEMAI